MRSCSSWIPVSRTPSRSISSPRTGVADVDVLIVGAGPAGAPAAETLRAEGFEGSVLLAGRELDPPYDRTPATKAYLQGRSTKDDHFLRPPGWWKWSSLVERPWR